MITVSKIWTYVLVNSTITISPSVGLNFRVVSFVLRSGSGSFSGALNMGAGLDSAPIPLIEDEPVTIGTDSTNSLDGLIISAVGGVVDIIGRT